MHAKIKQRKVCGHDIPWMNCDVRETMLAQNRAKKRTLRTKCELDWTHYKQCKNKVTNLIRQAKRKNYNDLITINISENMNRPDKLWATLKQKLPKSTNYQPNELSMDNETCCTPIQTANCFNNFFYRMGSN